MKWDLQPTRGEARRCAHAEGFTISPNQPRAAGELLRGAAEPYVRLARRKLSSPSNNGARLVVEGDIDKMTRCARTSEHTQVQTGRDNEWCESAAVESRLQVGVENRRAATQREFGQCRKSLAIGRSRCRLRVARFGNVQTLTYPETTNAAAPEGNAACAVVKSAPKHRRA